MENGEVDIYLQARGMELNDLLRHELEQKRQQVKQLNEEIYDLEKRLDIKR